MRKLGIFTLSVLTFLSLAAGFIPGGEHGHWWDAVPGFFIAFGFFGCILLIVFSKELGRRFLLKDDNYYHDQ